MRVKILIIDDDLVSQFATRYAVEQAISNTEIMVSDNSIGALALLSDMVTSGKGFPDIIFVDLIMPKMSGWEFIDITQKTFANMGQTSIYLRLQQIFIGFLFIPFPYDKLCFFYNNSHQGYRNLCV